MDSGPLTLRLGSSNAYLVPAGTPADTGYVLVDAGLAGFTGRFFRALDRHRIAPEQVRLIVVTHVHFDHVGGLAAIRARTGAPVLVHAAEADLLARGQAVIPPGTNLYGRVVHRLGQGAVRAGIIRLTPIEPDVIAHGGESLAAYGLDATILATPGHSAGSISVVGPDGRAFVGDVAVNYLPFGRGPLVPPFASALPEVFASWQKLLNVGAQRFYPGHGGPFSAAQLRSNLAALRPAA